ncbi:MAG: hypothetical protein ACRDJ3_05240 [Solirubrobacteraceae bacterium]
MATAGKRPIATAATFVAIVFLATAPPASASVGNTIVEKCLNGKPFSGYSPAAYREALKDLSTEAIEYSECGDLIRKAELAAAGGGTGASAGTAASKVALPLTPAEQNAVQKARSSHGSAPVKVGNEPIRPGLVHANITTAVNTLPHSLFALLAFLLAGVVILASGEVRKRVNARRNR